MSRCLSDQEKCELFKTHNIVSVHTDDPVDDLRKFLASFLRWGLRVGVMDDDPGLRDQVREELRRTGELKGGF